MIHLVTFSDESMDRSASSCIESAKLHGVDGAIHYAPTEKTSERGYGFWRWKPQIILSRMVEDSGFISPLQDGDILIYSDAGVEFINDVQIIVDRMDQDILLFGNQWEHAHWCKRDIVDAIWPVCVESGRRAELITDGTVKPPFMEPPNFIPVPWSRFGKQVQASVVFFRVSDYTRKFVKEWLDWCLFEGGRLIDDSPSRAPNHPEFQENRHDQAILTTMAYRDGIKLHWWPAVYGPGRHPYPKNEFTDDYPPIFLHHRRRNHEWEQVA